MNTLFELDQLQRGHNVIAPLLRVQFGNQQWQLYVFECRQDWNEIERLKHVADVLVPPLGGLSIVERKNVLAEHQQLASGGPINCGNHVQECGFARARRAH